MDVKEQLTQAINNAVKTAQAAGVLPEGELPSFVLEVPPKKELGDFATNVAMQSARVFRKKPRDIAEAITGNLSADFVDHTVIAGPGFINFYLKGNVLYDNLAAIIATQLLVWETVVGERDANFNHVSTGGYDTVKSVVSSNHPLYSQICSYYDSIVSSVQNHTKIPSFMARSTGKKIIVKNDAQ